MEISPKPQVTCHTFRLLFCCACGDDRMDQVEICKGETADGLHGRLTETTLFDAFCVVGLSTAQPLTSIHGGEGLLGFETRYTPSLVHCVHLGATRSVPPHVPTVFQYNRAAAHSRSLNLPQSAVLPAWWCGASIVRHPFRGSLHSALRCGVDA